MKKFFLLCISLLLNIYGYADGYIFHSPGAKYAGTPFEYVNLSNALTNEAVKDGTANKYGINESYPWIVYANSGSLLDNGLAEVSRSGYYVSYNPVFFTPEFFYMVDDAQKWLGLPKVDVSFVKSETYIERLVSKNITFCIKDATRFDILLTGAGSNTNVAEVCVFDAADNSVVQTITTEAMPGKSNKANEANTKSQIVAIKGLDATKSYIVKVAPAASATQLEVAGVDEDGDPIKFYKPMAEVCGDASLLADVDVAGKNVSNVKSPAVAVAALHIYSTDMTVEPVQPKANTGGFHTATSLYPGAPFEYVNLSNALCNDAPKTYFNAEGNPSTANKYAINDQYPWIYYNFSGSVLDNGLMEVSRGNIYVSKNPATGADEFVFMVDDAQKWLGSPKVEVGWTKNADNTMNLLPKTLTFDVKDTKRVDILLTGGGSNTNVADIFVINAADNSIVKTIKSEEMPGKSNKANEANTKSQYVTVDGLDEALSYYITVAPAASATQVEISYIDEDGDAVKQYIPFDVAPNFLKDVPNQNISNVKSPIVYVAALRISSKDFAVSDANDDSGMWGVTLNWPSATIASYLGSETEIVIPQFITYQDNKYQVEAISANAFSNNTAITSVTIPEGITSIGDSAFSYCYKLKKLELPASLKTIGSYAFEFCHHLTEIVIPATVNSIGDAFLSGCSGLQKINAKMATPQALHSTAFTDVDKNTCKLIVPAEYVDTYGDTPGWMAFKNIQAEDMANDTDLSAYDNVIYIEGAKAKVGCQQTLSLKMNNTIGITGFQCDVYLPEGIEIAKDADDFYEISLSTERTTAAKTNYFDSAGQPDGSVRIMCNSTRSYTFSGNEGEVATITVNIADGLEDGDYPLILRNIVLSDASANTYNVAQVKTTLSLTSYLLGDANNDSNINVGDFTAIANAIMGNPPATFVEKAADVNEDSEINVGDLTGVANLILYGVVSPTTGAKAINGMSYQPSAVSVEDCHISAGTEFIVAVDVTGSYTFSGYQFDMTLPEGISVKMSGDEPCAWLSTVRTSEKRTNFFASDMINENTVRILAASTNGYTFSGNEGNVAYVTLVADRDIANGEYTVGIDNIVLSANGNAYIPTATNFNVQVGNTTGINGVMSEDGNYTVYDLSGKMVSKTSSPKILKKGVYILNGNKIVK